MKTFPEKQKLRKFVASRPALQGILKFSWLKVSDMTIIQIHKTKKKTKSTSKCN